MKIRQLRLPEKRYFLYSAFHKYLKMFRFQFHSTFIINVPAPFAMSMGTFPLKTIEKLYDVLSLLTYYGIFLKLVRIILFYGILLNKNTFRFRQWV